MTDAVATLKRRQKLEKSEGPEIIFRDDRLFDTEGFKAGVQHVDIRFFCRPLAQMDGSGLISAKDMPHTNLNQSSMLDTPRQFRPKKVGLLVIGASVRDANHLALHGSIEVAYMNRRIFELPVAQMMKVRNAARRHQSEFSISVEPQNWLQRLLWPRITIDRNVEHIEDDAVLEYTPHSIKGARTVMPGECFSAKLILAKGLTPERDFYIRFICHGEIGEPEMRNPFPLGYPIGE